MKTLVTLLLILCLCGPTFAHDLQDALSRIDAHMVLAPPPTGAPGPGATASTG